MPLVSPCHGHLPRLYQALAILALLASITLTWSEATFFSEKPTLSILALVIQVWLSEMPTALEGHIFLSTQAGRFERSYGFIEAFSLLAICYMCICAYYTVFQVPALVWGLGLA